jgi:hypothetical protein
MLVLSKRVLWVLLVLNWVLVAAFAAVMVFLLSPGGHDKAIAAISQTHRLDQAEALVSGTIWLMAIGIAAGFAAHFLFRRMLAIIDTAIAGDPFTLVNAQRLRVVGWALLAIQLLDLLFATLSIKVQTVTGEDLGWSPSVGGWIAVLMVFVLARVFEQGSRMRDELAMTV